MASLQRVSGCYIIDGPHGTYKIPYCKLKKIFSISEDYLKYLSRSFSLPNLTFTPLESLIHQNTPKPDAEIPLTKLSFNYSDDFELDSTIPSPTKKSVFGISDDEGEMWQENLPATELQDLASSSNIFAFLESQRAVLEEKIGITTLMKVYKMIAKLEQSDDEKIDYSDLIRILGKGNEELIDDIIQLVVADQFFN